MTDRANDWADKLAREIVTEQQSYGDHPGFEPMLALRLRLLKHQVESEAFLRSVTITPKDAR